MTTVCKVIKNGPLEVDGNFEITGTDGKKVKMNGPIYLCRCGKSGNKPFCDGSHGM
jgi:CDGSH-type Zn-finger protein